MAGKLEAFGRIGVTSVVVGVGMAAGFTHTHAAAVRAGQTGWLAWADAVVIELAVIVAGWQLHHRRRVGGSLVFPGMVMLVAFLIQMGAQVSGAPKDFAGWLFASIPALGALVIIKMVMGGTGPVRTPVADQPVQVPEHVHAEAVREEPRPEIAPEVPSLAAAPDPAPEPAAAVITQWPPRR